MANIIANHTIVSNYSDIPQEYIDKIKNRWLVAAGESHSGAYRNGPLTIYSEESSIYAVRIQIFGEPEGATDQHIRISSGTWGDIDNSTGWIYSYGEDDWFTTDEAVLRTKDGITYCNTNDLSIGAMGFGWCYDPGIDPGEDTSLYLNATQEYVDYCSSLGYSTKIFFTTGTVDFYTGQIGYEQHQKYEQIRTYVNNSDNLILFDYADILCYDNNGDVSIATYGENEYPVIATENLTPSLGSHISSIGEVRIGKALWWMMAKIEGWDDSNDGSTNMLYLTLNNNLLTYNNKYIST